MGFVKIWDLTYILKRLIPVKKCKKTQEEFLGNKYFPNRIEGVSINARYVKSLLRAATKRSSKSNGPLLNPLRVKV